MVPTSAAHTAAASGSRLRLHPLQAPMKAAPIMKRKTASPTKPSSLETSR